MIHIHISAKTLSTSKYEWYSTDKKFDRSTDKTSTAQWSRVITFIGQGNNFNIRELTELSFTEHNVSPSSSPYSATDPHKKIISVFLQPVSMS
jgi:hypothetical protein